MTLSSPNLGRITFVPAFLNRVLLQILVIPLLLSLGIAVFPPVWNLDLTLSQITSLRKQLVNPSPEVVMVTIDEEDDRLFSPQVHGSMFDKGASRWRQIHAEVINRLSASTSKPRAIGLDILFDKSQTEFDDALIKSLQNADKQNVNLVLGVKDKALDSDHWMNRLYKTGVIQLGSVVANQYSDSGLVKSILLKNSFQISGEPAQTFTIPSLAVALYSRHADLSELPAEVTVKLANRPFLHYNYRDILDRERFDEIQSDFENRIVVIGAEHPGDVIGFPFIPAGQPKLSANRIFGVFYHANAVNYMVYRKSLQEIEGLGKLFLLVMTVILINSLNLVLKRFGLIYRVLVSIGVLTGFNYWALGSDWVIPLASVNLAAIIGLGVVLLPELVLLGQTLRLKRLRKFYPHMAQELFRQTGTHLSRPCHNLVQLSDLILSLNKIFVEAKGHTRFEEMDFRFFLKQELLVPDFTLSKKRPDSIGRADFLKEEFVGTRIRRLRNYLSHANLNDLWYNWLWTLYPIIRVNPVTWNSMSQVFTDFSTGFSKT